MGKKKVQYTEEDNKKAASHRLKEARVDKKTAIEINIEYKWVNKWQSIVSGPQVP